MVTPTAEPIEPVMLVNLSSQPDVGPGEPPSPGPAYTSSRADGETVSREPHKLDIGRFDSGLRYQPPALFPAYTDPDAGRYGGRADAALSEISGNAPVGGVGSNPATGSQSLVEAATARVNAQGGSLTEDEVIAVLRAAGAPEAWIPDMVAISQCESRHSPYAVGDGGNSLGMFQTWFGWARAYGVSVEELFDPLVNAKVALYIRGVRGRFGGAGGWSCADHLGIP